jgi:uncharacterized tellurite resistance protein B-like protein
MTDGELLAQEWDAQESDAQECDLQNGDAYASVLLRVIVIMMLADGEIADAEVSTIVKVYHQKTGIRLDHEAINLAIEETLADKEDSFVQMAGAALSAEQKVEILRGAAAVSMADNALGDTEGSYLLLVAEQLGVPGAELSAILQEAAASLHPTA